MTELLLNPGFETRVGNDWSNWLETGSPVAETTIVHSGSCSVNLSANNAGMISDYVAFDPGYFVFSAWLYGTGSAQIYLIIYEYSDGHGGAIYNEGPLTVPNGTWTKITRYFDTHGVHSNARMTVVFRHEGTTGTSLYIDDASLEQVSSWEEAFHNGAFEEWRSENNHPTMWVGEAYIASCISKDGTTKHGGTYSVRLEKVSVYWDPQVSQIFEVPPGRYTISLYGKSDGTAKGGITLNAWGNYAFGESYQNLGWTNTGWQLHTWTVDVPNDAAEHPTFISIRCYTYDLGPNGYIWFDDVEFDADVRGKVALRLGTASGLETFLGDAGNELKVSLTMAN